MGISEQITSVTAKGKHVCQYFSLTECLSDVTAPSSGRQHVTCTAASIGCASYSTGRTSCPSYMIVSAGILLLLLLSSCLEVTIHVGLTFLFSVCFEILSSHLHMSSCCQYFTKSTCCCKVVTLPPTDVERPRRLVLITATVHEIVIIIFIVFEDVFSFLKSDLR